MKLWETVSNTDEFKDVLKKGNRKNELSWKTAYNRLSGKQAFTSKNRREILHMTDKDDSSVLAMLADFADTATPMFAIDPTIPSLKLAVTSTQEKTSTPSILTAFQASQTYPTTTKVRRKKTSSATTKVSHKKTSSSKLKNASVSRKILPLARAPPKKMQVIKRHGAGSFENRKCDFCGVIPTNHYCRAPLPGSMICMQGNEGEEVCGKVSCMMCREKWGNAEDFANRCISCKEY